MSLIDLMGSSPIASQRLYWLFTWNYFSFVGLHDVYIYCAYDSQKQTYPRGLFTTDPEIWNVK